VAMNVKYHSNHEMQDLYIVENVSKSTNLNKVAGLDLAEVPGLIEMIEVPVMVDDQVAEDQVMEEIQETMDQKKCLMQPVLTVEMTVKYHLDQEAINLFTVENVSRIINQNNVVGQVMAEDQVMVDVQVAEDQVMVDVQVAEDQVMEEVEETEKCLLQPVVTVEMNVKYHLDQERTDLFIVTNVSMITEISNESTFLILCPFPIIPRKRKDECNKQYPQTSHRVSNQATKERTR